ncbi:hypothetical protein J421_5358 (plasmid) [Gemmatirosa kalamazoonensis]|uniref:Uncharacterized protein n=1 Tax=Gemmatirosa kalamazoonensis TaxID=861299 RepID=W0RTH9_9BACT|nr:hypothetical protein [Gemmatirosa kalamazoonensis]AHG92893.1 hypothetical protein J421_5358 [Gemmatirosa kalamazoonensis]
METLVWLAWSLAAGALLLGLAAIPLAYRRAPRRVWVAHGVLTVGVGAGLVAAAHAAVYGGVIPWWQTGAGYLAALSAPPLAAGWAARAGARRWATHARWRVGVVTLAVLLGVGGAAARVAAAMLPELINAVQ